MNIYLVLKILKNGHDHPGYGTGCSIYLSRQNHQLADNINMYYMYIKNINVMLEIRKSSDFYTTVKKLVLAGFLKVISMTIPFAGLN